MANLSASLNNLFKRPGKKSEKSEEANEQLATEDFVYSPPTPVVNVLPEDIRSSYAISKLWKKFTRGGVALFLAFAVLYLFGFVANQFSASEITNIDNESASLRQQLNALQPYSSYKTQIEAKRTALFGELQDDIDVERILGSLNDIGDANGIIFNSIDLSITQSGETGSSCTNPDPFTTVPTIGCVTLTGTSAGREATNSFFSGIDNTEGFENGFINGVTNSAQGRSTFNGSVSITDLFYSGDYANLSTPLTDVLNGTVATTTEGE